jgi:PEP-CTERM motif
MKLLKSILNPTTKILVIAAGCAGTVDAETIAEWTFEDSYSYIQANPGPGTTLTGISPEVGTGAASGLHTSSATTWSAPAGNGSSHSLSAKNWSEGDYYQFETSTAGFDNITVSYDQTSSSTGPGSFSLQYSTDGENFTSFQAYGVQQGSWNTTSSNSACSYLFDLSPVADLNNAPNVYFRLVNAAGTTPSGGSISTAGSDRIDNFTIGVAAVPEPHGLFILGGLGLLGMSMVRRRRQNA